MKYKQVVVVEGKHDEQKLKSIYPDLECIVTNGSEISKETINLIYETSKKREVVLFLDPDFPGKKITNKILEKNGNFKIAYINKENAISKNNRKVGVEHANKEDIKKSLSSMFTVGNTTKPITTKDLMQRELINKFGSSKLRNDLCKALNIPIFNGKSFLNTLNMLCITLKEIDSKLKEVKYGKW